LGPDWKTTPFQAISGDMVLIPPTVDKYTGGANIWMDAWFLWNTTFTDPRVGGDWRIHCKFMMLKYEHPTPYWGPSHGEWTMDVDRDGEIEWEGQVNVWPFTDHFVTHYSGHGVGKFKGLLIEMGDDNEVFSGQIFEPQAKK
jgi:hypothetical protein